MKPLPTPPPPNRSENRTQEQSTCVRRFESSLRIKALEALLDLRECQEPISVEHSHEGNRVVLAFVPCGQRMQKPEQLGTKKGAILAILTEKREKMPRPKIRAEMYRRGIECCMSYLGELLAQMRGEGLILNDDDNLGYYVYSQHEPEVCNDA